MRKILLLLALPSLYFFTGCNSDKSPAEVMGYAPVYADSNEVKTIQFLTPRATVNAGKIYSYKDFTFQVETGRGIHVIYSQDPANATKVGFLSVYGCTELSIKNDRLYTNNLSDLVSIDIQNISQAKLVSRVPNVFPGVSQFSPPHDGVYFECVDPTQGMVIGWTEKLLNHPQCKR